MVSRQDLRVFHISEGLVFVKMYCWKAGETEDIIIEHAFAALLLYSSSFSAYSFCRSRVELSELLPEDWDLVWRIVDDAIDG
jgi:hypothetical protein